MLNNMRPPRQPSPPITIEDALSLTTEELLSKLGSSLSGLSSDNAANLLEIYGPNEITKRKKRSAVLAFLLHFRNPLVIILLVAGAITGLLGEITNAVIIYIIITMSVGLSFYQESKAEKAAESRDSSPRQPPSSGTVFGRRSRSGKSYQER